MKITRSHVIASFVVAAAGIALAAPASADIGVLDTAGHSSPGFVVTHGTACSVDAQDPFAWAKRLERELQVRYGDPSCT